MGLNLPVGVLGNTLDVALGTRALAYVVTMARLLDNIALLYLAGALAYFHLFVADVIAVLVSLHLKGLIALARHSRPLRLPMNLR